MQTPQVSIIIPVFNKWELTRNCLESLREHTPEDIEVIVVDNASTDQTPRELAPLGEALFGPPFSPGGNIGQATATGRHCRARFRAIRNPENINFGPACNLGAEAAAAPLLLFLNNDTLLTPGWLPPLLKTLEQPGAGAAGPLLLYENRTVQHLGIAFSITGTVSHLYGGFPETHPAVKRPRKLQAITAAAMLLGKELFFEAGAFYPEYRNGFEDVELCGRIRQLGRTLHCVADSTVFHLEGQSPGRTDNDRRNAELLSSRCRDMFRPDLHQHGLRDGFRVAINDRLGTSLLVGEKQERELREEAAGQNAGELLEKVRANPYWLSGIEQLSAVSRANGLMREAAHTYAHAVKILPNLAYAEKLHELAILAGKPQLAASAAETAAMIKGQLKDGKKYEASIKRLLNVAENWNDRFLVELYREKLAAWQKRAG